MKNFIKLFSVFTLLFIVSCSDNDEVYEPETINNNVNMENNLIKFFILIFFKPNYK